MQHSLVEILCPRLAICKHHRCFMKFQSPEPCMTRHDTRSHHNHVHMLLAAGAAASQAAHHKFSDTVGIPVLDSLCKLLAMFGCSVLDTPCATPESSSGRRRSVRVILQPLNYIIWVLRLHDRTDGDCVGPLFSCRVGSRSVVPLAGIPYRLVW